MLIFPFPTANPTLAAVITQSSFLPSPSSSLPSPSSSYFAKSNRSLANRYNDLLEAALKRSGQLNLQLPSYYVTSKQFSSGEAPLEVQVYL